MMKKTTKILVVAVSFILLLSVLIFGSSAEEAPEASAVDGTPVFEVKYQDGRSEYFYTWKSTLAATEDNCIITLLEDYEEGVIVDNVATPLNSKGVVLDLNGKTLSSSWTTNSAGGATWQRTVVQNDASITVVGNGTIRSASAFFQVTGGTVTINPGEGKTINITAIGGYKYSGGNVTTSTFSGAPFFKIGNNGNANNPNVENSGKACALNIIGNVNYIEDNTGTAVTFIGLYPGAKLNIGDPDANVNTSINATFNSTSTVFLEYLWFASATPDKYTVFSENGAFLPAEANISNVDINMPYGSFVKTANYSKVKTFDEAARLNVYKADLNFNGNGTLKQTDFQFNDNAKVFARFTETKIVSDADRVLYANCSTHIPNALTIFKDCYVDTAAYSSSTKQQLFRYSGTVIVDGGYYDVTDDYFFVVGYSWTTPENHSKALSAGGLPSTTALPAYADPANEGKEWYVGGYGHVVKNGTKFESTPSGLINPATYSNGFTGWAKEDQNAKYYYKLVVNEDDTLSKAIILDSLETMDNVLLGSPSGKTTSSTNVDFNASTPGEFHSSTVSGLQGITVNAGSSTDGYRTGKWSIVNTPAIYNSNNRYLVVSHYYATGMISTTAHTSSGYNHNHGSQNSKNAIYNPIKDFGMYSVTMDVMAPEGDFYPITVGYQIRLPHDAIDGTIYQQYPTLNFGISGDDGMLTVAGHEVGRIDEGRWYRITGVLSLPKTESGEVDFANLSKTTIEIYVDGKHEKTVSSLINSKYNYTDTNQYYKNDGVYTTDYANVEEIRFTFTQSTSTSKAGEKTAIDNIVLQQWAKSYDGNAQDVATYMQSAYAMPQGISLLKVNGEDYFDCNEAMLAAIAASQSKAVSVELFGNIDETINLDALVTDELNYPITVTTGGFDFDVDAVNYKVVEDDATITLRRFTKGDYLNVNWYSNDGELLRSDLVEYGTELTDKPSYSQDVNNGWYKASYNNWSTTPGGEAITDFTVERPMNYYLAAPVITPYPSAVRYNVTLVTHLQLNFCVPVELPDGVELVGVYGDYDENGVPSGVRPIVRQNVNYGDGVLYNEYSRSWPGISGVKGTASAPIVIVYDVTLPDGSTVRMDYKLNLKILDYFDYILSNNSYSSAQGVVADIVQYIYKAQVAAGINPDSSLSTLYTTKAQPKATNLTTVKNKLASSSSQNYSTIANYVKSISFSADSYEPAFKVVLEQGVTKVDFQIEGYGGSKKSLYYNTSTITYGLRSGASYQAKYDVNGNIVLNSKVVDEDGKVITDVTAGTLTNELAIVQSTGIPACNLNMQVKIRLTLTDGSVIWGYYDLATYYNGIKSGADAKALDFVAAVSALGTSAAKYRYPAGPVKLSDVINKEVVIKYSDFGAVGDGVTDDLAAIVAAHAEANSFLTLGFTNVIVEAEEGKTYYIGKNEANVAVSVKTDTDWKNCKFIFDDSKIKPFIDANGVYQDRDPDTKNDKDFNPARVNPIFNVTPSTGAKDVTSQISSINVGATNVGFKPGYKAVLRIENANVKHYIRVGINANEGANQQEVILVDANGNIDPSTPVLWDYTTITSATLYYADDKPITLKNATIETISNTAPNLYTSFGRNINITRSNVTVSGVTHTLTNQGDTRAPYKGIFYAQYAYNVTIRDAVVMHHEDRYDESSGALLGTYEFGANGAIGVKWINCSQTNFFTEDGGITYKGLFGTNYCRNVLLEDCFITSFDAHSGLHNATLRNSTFEHINFIGGGDLNIENVTIYADYTRAAIKLRDDYGCTWNGNVNIDGLLMKYISSEVAELSVFYAIYRDHNFGYDCYFPTEITINALSIAKVAPTKFSSDRLETDETVVSTNAIPVHLCKGLESVTVNTETATNKYYGTDTLTITNCQGIDWVLPNTKQFTDMQVYIDGKKVTLWKYQYGHNYK